MSCQLEHGGSDGVGENMSRNNVLENKKVEDLDRVVDASKQKVGEALDNDF